MLLMLVPHLRREKPLPFPMDMGKRLPPDKQEIVMLERLVTYLVRTHHGTNLPCCMKCLMGLLFVGQADYRPFGGGSTSIMGPDAVGKR